MEKPGRRELGQAIGSGAECRRRAGHGLGRMHTPDIDHFRQGWIDLAQLKNFSLWRGQMTCGSGNLVIDHERRLVHGIVLRLIAQAGIGFDHHTQVDELAEGQQVGPGTGQVEIDLDVVPASIVPVDAGYLGNPHAGEAMRTPLANRRNGATTDARIRDAWPLDLEAWFNDVAYR